MLHAIVLILIYQLVYKNTLRSSLTEVNSQVEYSFDTYWRCDYIQNIVIVDVAEMIEYFTFSTGFLSQFEACNILVVC